MGVKIIQFGYISKRQGEIEDYVEKNKEEASTLGFDHIFGLEMSILNENNISDAERFEIIFKWERTIEDIFSPYNKKIRPWVANEKIKGSSNKLHYFIDDEILTSIRKLPGGDIVRDFYKFYHNNNKFPNSDIVLINTDGYKNKLLELVENIQNEDLSVEIINFIKWLYYASFMTIKFCKNLSVISFSECR